MTAGSSAQADPGPGEKIVVGPIDLAALRAERHRRRGHQSPFAPQGGCLY